MDNKSNFGFMHNQKPSTQQVHLSDYFNIIRKRKWIVISFFLIVVCVVAFKTRATKHVYKANAKVFIAKQASFMERMAEVNIDPMETFSSTQYKLLESRELASKVIDDLELRGHISSVMAQKADFLTLALNRVMRIIRSVAPRSSRDSSDTLNALHREKNEDVLKNMDLAVNWYLKNLDVLPNPGTSLVDISFFSQSPEIAARVANAHARAFIENNNKLQRLASQQALDWIKKQLRDHKIKMVTSQRKVNEFKYEQLSPLFLDYKSVLSLPEFAENPIIQDLREKLNELKVQKTALTSKYGPKYPKIIEIDTSIKRLGQEIINEVQMLRLTIKAELDRTQLLEKSVQQAQDVKDQEFDTFSSEAINYDMLQLEADSDQEIYNILLTQAKELNLTGHLERNNIRIIDEAEISRFPVKPNVFLNLFLSVVLGLAFGSGFAFFFEYMDNTVRTPEDITHTLGTPVLGMLPYDKSLKRMNTLALASDQANHENKKIEYGYGQHDISSNLITGLSLMHSRGPGQVFLVESATSGEGKTTFLAKSAINLAMGGLRVLMIDADFQRPSLYNLFKLKNNGDRGLINAMESTLSYDVRQGTLDKCSVDDLFFIIGLKRHSGQLVIRSDDQAMTVFFENGRLVYLQSKDVPFASRLGAMLQRGGFITGDQLKDALERNQRTGQPLGYILINAGYINQDQLQGPLKLQMEEHLQKLFSWKHGSFSFEPGGVVTCEDKRIYFQEDYTPIINHLSRSVGSRLLEKDILSYIQSVNVPNLSLLPAGRGDTRTGSSIYFALLLGKYFDFMKQRFDVILVDTPPILETMCSASPLFSIVDGVIFVVKSGHVSVKHIKEAKDHLKKGKANVIGTILNQVKVGKRHNSYYYT